MEIICELKDFRKDENTKPSHLEKEKYLYVYKNGGEPVEILFSKFEKLYADSKNINNQSCINDIGMEVKPSNQISLLPSQTKPNFNQLVKYLVKKLNIIENDFKENKLIVEANLSNFLELPWEDVIEKNIVVYRKVKGERKSEIAEVIDNNLLFVVSNAHKKITGNNLGSNLKDKINKEILNITELILDVEPKKIKFSNIDISKHTDKTKFNLLLIENYNYIHFIMHGNKDGSLCLETPNENCYKNIVFLNSEEIKEKLKGNNIFLLFFSLCNSGGSLIGSNLAFELAFHGIAKYIIAYRYGTGENSALEFAQIFYRKLLNGEIYDTISIVDVYEKSLIEFYKNKKDNIEYIPLLYINE